MEPHEPLAAAVGRRVRELRSRQHLTLDQLAERSGLQPQSILRIEQGKRGASLDSLRGLALGLGVQISELFDAPAPELAPEVRLLAQRLAAADDRTRRLVTELLDLLDR